MADRAIISCWVVHYSPELLEPFTQRKRPVTSQWHVDGTYIEVRGRWMCRYRAIDSNGATVEFCFRERRNLTVAKRLFRKALKRRGCPKRIVVYSRQPNMEAILSYDTVGLSQNRSRWAIQHRPLWQDIPVSTFLRSTAEFSSILWKWCCAA